MMKAYSISLENIKVLSDGWVFERKYDGVRQLWVSGKLFSEFGVDNTSKFNHIKEELEGVDAVLDGEICLENGSSIDIKERKNWNKVSYVVFDLLKLGKVDLTKLPLIERRKILFKLFDEKLKNKKFIKLSVGFFNFDEAWKQVLKNNWEGLIAKNLYSPYEGSLDDLFKINRSWNWLKIKNWKEAREEIIGFEKSGSNTVFSKGSFILKNNTKVSALSKAVVKEYESLKQFGKVYAEIYYLKKTKDGKYFHPKLKRLCLESNELKEGDKIISKR
jgi:ATP-dependent DNA ligase